MRTPSSLVALILLALVGLLLPLWPAAADESGPALTRETTGTCGDWPSPLDPEDCYVHAMATLTVTGCDESFCDFTLAQSGDGHVKVPGLLRISVVYARTDYVDGSGAPLSDVCQDVGDLAIGVGCSALTQDRAHVPPGECSGIVGGALLAYEMVEDAQANPTFEICRDASGTVSVI